MDKSRWQLADGVIWSEPRVGGRVRCSAYCSCEGVLLAFELLLLPGMLTLRVLSEISGEFFGQQDHMQVSFVLDGVILKQT